MENRKGANDDFANDFWVQITCLRTPFWILMLVGWVVIGYLFPPVQSSGNFLNGTVDLELKAGWDLIRFPGYVLVLAMTFVALSYSKRAQVLLIRPERAARFSAKFFRFWGYAFVFATVAFMLIGKRAV